MSEKSGAIMASLSSDTGVSEAVSAKVIVLLIVVWLSIMCCTHAFSLHLFGLQL